MNRPIRFRAWDEKLKKMFVPNHIDGHGFLVTEERHVEDTDEMGRPTRYGTHPIEYPNPYVLMQFTGLLDRYGKEVYEGDIVEVKEYNHERRVVFFADCMFTMNESGDANRSSQPLIGYGLSVIGNIYSNPDLISKTPSV